MKVWSRVVLAAAAALAMSAAAAYAATAPTRVTRLSAAAGDEQVTVSWSPPASGTPPFTYKVTGSPGGYATTDSTTSRTVTNLTNGTLYTFKVFPINASGGGPGSTVTTTPRAVPPGAPTNFGAVQGPGAGQMTLSWTPPTSTGSFPSSSTPPTIDHYTVTVSPGGISQQVGADTTTLVASNLADNITYTFTITATNSRTLTGAAATVYAPLPSGATIGLDPTAGGATTDITATGQSFLKNESITLYWDDPSHVAAAVVTDANGAFTKVVKPFSGDKPKVHKLCASVPPKPCATFTLQGPPSPTPTAPTTQESPSPTQNQVATPARIGGGISGLDIITRPPFVFLPIIGILGLLGVIAYLVMAGRRRPVTPTSATVVHRATRPDYSAPFPNAGQPPTSVPPAASAAQPALDAPWQRPIQPPPSAPAPPPAVPPPAAPPPPVEPPQAAPPATWEPPPAPTTWPAAPDEPPDLPEPSD